MLLKSAGRKNVGLPAQSEGIIKCISIFRANRIKVAQIAERFANSSVFKLSCQDGNHFPILDSSSGAIMKTK